MKALQDKSEKRAKGACVIRRRLPIQAQKCGENENGIWKIVVNFPNTWAAEKRRKFFRIKSTVGSVTCVWLAKFLRITTDRI